MKYKVLKKDEPVVVSGVNHKGEPIEIQFKAGAYTTTDDDEIAVLDAAATDAGNAVAFDQKEA